MTPPTTLVLLPGMDGSGTLFADFVRMLDPQVRPIVVSYPKVQPLDYNGLVDFVLPHLPTDQRFVLLGESFSGPVAISIAARRPTLLAGLILSCSFARYPTAMLRPLKFLTPLMPMQRELSGLVAPFMFGQFSSAAMKDALYRALDGVTGETLRTRLHAVLDVDTTGRLRDIGVPVLYLQAAQDRVVAAAAEKCIARHLPAMKTVRLTGPHLLLQTRPAETAQVIAEFIRSLGSTEGIAPQ